MSRPYEFAEESTTKSPLDQRRPNPFPSGQPPSFKTNVNRAKTKRWVEAKSYSYDGDDWGDYDEVDEYGASQAAQNAIPAVPTGLRQQGQGLNPGQGQTRSFTNPEGPYEGHQGPPGPARKRSFDAGEEQRKFSTGSYPAPVPNQQGFPQLPQGANPPRHLGPGQPPLQLDTITSSPAAYGPADSRNSAKAESRSASLAHSVVSDAPSSVNPEHRRDFSPSAMVQPLRPSPSPSMPPSAVDSPGQARFPPRRSSVSKSQQDSPAPQAPGPFPAPQSEQGSSQAPPTHSSQQATSPSNPAKPLPFIRPSDIYKRMEEERAKERASMDSERPSIDSVGGRSGEDAASPAPSGKGPKERTSFESLGRSPGRRPSLGTVSETMKVEPRPRDRSESQNRRGTPALERVEERKSEYLPEYDANTLREQPTGIQISATIPPTSGTTSSNPDPYALPQWEQPQSNFSDEFWSNSGWKEGSPVDSRSAQSALPPNPQSDQPISNQAAKPLEHTPSLGFRSAVDTAFTAAEPQSAVDTDTDVSRSNTVSTSEISPITSKLPASLDTYHPTSKHPTIPEDGREEPQVLPLHQRHESLETPKAAQFTLPRKPSPVNTPSHSRHASAEFVPGYRRDLNTPSPNNSPARSPALAPQKELFKPSEAELDTTSPVEPQDVSKQPHRATDLDKPLPAPVPSILPLGSGPRSRSVSPVKDSQSSSRAGSPTKSRVRDLAVQYEKRGSVSSIDSWERPDSRPPSRPPSRPEPTQTQPEVQQASEETARPRVPGAWMSYTTNQSSSRTGSRDNLSSDPSAIDAVVREGPVEEHTTSTGGLSLSDDAYKFIQEEEKERKKIKLTEDPVSTLATAGSALGAGVVGALGLSKHSNNGDDEKPPSVPEKDTGSPKDVRNMSDQLTDEIERRLSSFDSHAESHYSPGQPAAVPTHLDPSAAGPAHDTNRDSSVLPSEYDSYWATGPSIESKPPEPHGLGVNVPSQEALPPAVPVKDEPAVSNPPLLKKRFSWEQSFDNVADLGLTPPPFSPDTDSKPTQTVSSAPSQPTMPQAQASGILQERTGETPVQIGASTPFDSLDSIQPTPKSAFIAPSDREPPSVEVSLPPGASQTPVHEREPLSPLSAMSGSHPSNLSASDTSLGKEAGDPSRTVSPMKSDDGLHLVSVQSNIEKDSDNDKEILPAPHGSTPHPSEKNADDIPTPTSVGGALPQPSANRDSAPAKAPPTFREILAIKSTPDRIQAYSNTREQFASTDTGIGSWLDETVATYPEHQSLASSVWQSQANQSGPMAGHTLPTPPGVERGHKSSPSLSRFGLGALTGGGSTSGQTPGPSFSASRRVSSNLASSSPTGGDGAGQSEGKGQQIGKDLLHSAGILGGKAGILGGKATTGAKGLLAKSKNRFKHGGDKVG
ncbi:hypothetical protein P152DRAFT_472391 [Eremomyces bilateralis CBS 781.70]|uniref:Uncharacterized protein n=1 Tax=Eremomyces bilateralis CBS 781.70 TaxID=1392243 RepID=A0A6G1G9S4_9PEZI|nr:uncharacterized protein P152DRAFT_472391 [Eremomyces bilateralis CBS 781.70]KAF1814651.1 hypothetical protein P152DRAFT_472391 [Eremomyces bilateralis CBS 781.70]